MSLKNNWKPKTDDDYVEAEDINAVADAVIELEKKTPSGGVTPDGTPIIIDDQMSPTSENPVQNKVVFAYVEEQNNQTKGLVVAAGQTAQQANQKAQETSKNLAEHTTSEEAHNDIRILVTELTNRLNSLADSDDTTLDQLSEIVAYIKSNKNLIDSITTSKVNVVDIIDNLTTNLGNRPLSAKQGVVLKGLINSIVVPTSLSQLGQDATHRLVTDAEKQTWNNKLNTSDLSEAVNDALAQAKASGEFDGSDGISATHSWNGTILTVKSASGTSSANLKGEKGDAGEISVKSPTYAETVDDMTDTSRVYLGSNGNIWAYSEGLVENKVNQYNSATAKFDSRVHPAYIGTENDPWRVTKGFLHVEIDGLDFTNKSSYIIRFSGVTPVRHTNMGAIGQVVFFNKPAVTPWDFTGYTSDKYINTQGAFQIEQDDIGYYVDIMKANPATDTIRCYFSIVLADNVSISATDCQNLFIEAVPQTTYITEYSWQDTGIAYANYVLTDDDTSIIADKVNKKINSVIYVDGEIGDDTNEGSQDSPLKTIQKAIDSGAKTIYCKAGTYKEDITLNNAHGVKIIGQWETYESGNRPKVRIDHSATLTPADNGNGLKTMALPADVYKNEHPLLYNVFVTKQYQPTIGSGTTIGYVVSLWNVTDEQVSTHYKLVPVMTLAECQSTEESFFYDGTTLYIHSTGSTFKMVSTNRRNAVENCSDIVFEDIAFDYCYNDALAVNNSNDIVFRNCEFSHSSTACGVATVNMNGEFYNCEAYCNRLDGFNFHDFGETTIYNCIGAYNYDDGISHHDGCTGSIQGGQYHHNGKGGVSSPTYGAMVDVYNVNSHDNQYGIYAVGGTANRQIIVSGCYIHHNRYGITSSYQLLAVNSTIKDNSADTSVTGSGNVSVVTPM